MERVAVVVSVVGFPGVNWWYGKRIVDIVGKAYTFGIGQRILQNSDHVFLLGNNVLKYARSLGVDPGKVSVNSFGVELHNSSMKTVTNLRKELEIQPGETVVLFAGRYEPVKRPIDFAVVAQKLSERFPDIRFLMIGGGPLRKKLDEYASPRLRILDWRNDVLDCMSVSDFLVLPSLSEGLPGVIMESFAVGRPVVATDVGCNRDLVSSERGILVRPRRMDELENAISALYGNPALSKRMGDNGRRFVEKDYSWDTILQKYEENYSRVLKID